MNKVMVTFKRFRSLGLIAGLCFIVCLLATPAAKAQLVEATILTTNVDVQKKKLYVEMNYTPRACGSYQLRFKLKTDDDAAGKYAVIELDSVITNNTGSPKIGKFTLPSTVEGGAEIDVLNLDNTAVGGYNLRFAINTTPMITADKHPTVCMETYKLAYHCKRCQPGGGDINYTSRDILPGCPYTGDDVVYCKPRSQGNWELYIQDPRDCNVYNAVQVGTRWWFAQNLNYQKDLTGDQSAQTATQNSIFFCPGRRGGNNTHSDEWFSTTNEPIGRWSCQIYGALYTWNTARALDGGAPGAVNSESTLPAITTPSTLRGICPPNWFLPNDADWGIMLNNVDGCATPESSIAADLSNSGKTDNCTHFVTMNVSSAASDVLSMSMGGNVDAVLNSYPLGNSASVYARTTAEMCVTGGVFCDDAALSAGANPPAYSTKWANSTSAGLDSWGLKVRPAGYRYSPNSSSGGTFYGRGEYAAFLSSTRWSDTEATPVIRVFRYDNGKVMRGYAPAASGNNNAYSVRCVR